ncbi:SRPBCC domain-containing protein [Martelella sp. FLE1502]
MDVRLGGAFVTEMSENDGPFVPHLSACFLDVLAGRRIIYTNAPTGGWRPAANGFVPAIITLSDHPDGTHYRAQALHKSRADREKHEELGFHDGWGTVVAQLAELAETKS